MTFGNKKDEKLAKVEERPVTKRIWFDPFAEFDRFFDDPFFFPRMGRRMVPSEFRVGVPSVDISDEVDHIRILADMPGVTKEDVEVEIDDDVLQIKAKTDVSEEDSSGNYIRRERRTSSFQRSFLLPEDVMSDEIKASMKDGVLNITIPKVEPKQPKKVSIDVD